MWRIGIGMGFQGWNPAKNGRKMEKNMKKLLLASNGKFLIDKGYNLIGIPKEKIKIAYIITASKGVKNLSYLDTHREDMRAAGLDFEEIDIENKTLEELRKFMSDKNVIHMEGGNAFYLLRVIRKTGFDEVVKELVSNGVVYAGTSAGAYIACPTIETSTWGPNKKEDYGLTDLTGLGFVPFLIKAHYKDELANLFKEKIRNASCPVRLLRDGQGILVEDDSHTFVGEGKEVGLS